MPSKKLYIISGCNGAGKTTASVTILPEILDCKEFVNADEIARGLSPFNPESVAILAGRLMLERIEYLLDQNESFAIETTLSTKSYQKLVAKAHEKGFYVQLLYFCFQTAFRRNQKLIRDLYADSGLLDDNRQCRKSSKNCRRK